jgi:hypothetical protein
MYWFIALLVLVAVGLAIWWWRSRRPVKMTHGIMTHALTLGITTPRVLTIGVCEEGHSVWCFEGGKWCLIEDESAPGFIPGPPPVEPGSFEGHCKKVTSVRAPGAR